MLNPYFLRVLGRAALLASVLTSILLGSSGYAAAEDSNLPERVVRGIRQGSEIEYLGIITVGAAAELRAALAANPHAAVLHLNSPGGDVTEAYRMADLLRARHLIVTVDKFCDSACTIVFLAGQARLIAPGAKLGFHRPWVAGMSSADIDMIVQRDRRYMAVCGIPNWFIDKAYSIPNSSAWYPTTTELSAAA